MSETYTPSPVPSSDQQPGRSPVPVQRRGAGGTPGGIGSFLIGVVMVAVGGWLITNQVTVTGSGFSFFGTWFGSGGFGLTMLPLLVGIGILFMNGKSVLGWLVTISGMGMILAAVLMNLSIFWAPTSLFNTVMMWGILAGGLGLVFRSLRAHGPLT
jgi:hypothetical protein